MLLCAITVLLVSLTQPTTTTSDLGTIHYEESYQLLHGELNTVHTLELLEALERFGKDLIKKAGKLDSTPNSKKLQTAIGKEVSLKAVKLRNVLQTATFSLTTKKRGLDFLGDWLHQLTGVVGPYQHEKDQASLGHIKSALESQDKLNMQLGSDVSKLFTKISKEESQIILINKHFDHLYSKIDARENDILKCIQLLLLKLEIDGKTENISTKISDYNLILIEAKNHFLSNRLINATELQLKIKEITADTRDLVPIIDYKQAAKYYTLPITRAVFIKGNIHIFTRIPMIRPEASMKIYHVDLTRKIMNGHKQQNFEYILVNDKNTYFSTMTAGQMEKTIQIKGTGLLTDIRPIETQIHVEHCTTANCASRYCSATQIRKNTFLYEMPFPSEATTYCEHKDNSTKRTLTTRGTIVLSPDCSLQTKYFYIHRVISHGNTRFFSYEPTLKLEDLSSIITTTESDVANINDTISGHKDKIQTLNKEINSIQVNSTLMNDNIRMMKTEADQIAIDNSSHWGISISGLVLGCICLLCAIFFCMSIYCVIRKVSKISERAAQLSMTMESNEKARSGL